MTTLSASSTTDGSISFREVSVGSIEYQIGTNGWNPVPAWPVTIVNTNPSANLQILFTTTITIDDSNKYFICGSSNLQFGNQSIRETGERSIINVVDIGTSHSGLIQNGTETTSGYNDIYVYNIYINSTDAYISDGVGWVGQKGFGNSSINNYIVNCASNGGFSSNSGGIVGAYAAKGTGAQLVLIGCANYGTFTVGSGGIVGSYAGQNGGSVLCEQCWSTGNTGAPGTGGIFGAYAGENGFAQATKCYSTGIINAQGGGIFGQFAGNLSGVAIAEKCYSNGNGLSFGAGGIFGRSAGSNSGTTSAINCYSSGFFAFTNGIYGTGKVNGTEVNCYASFGSWSSSAANASLQGVPSPTVGITWVATVPNQPYELNAIGYTPYSTEVITSIPTLNQEYSQTIHAGQTTVSALMADASGNAFTILQIEDGDIGSYSTLSMSSQTGAITTTEATVPGSYTVILRSVGSYNITRFLLTILSPLPATGGGTEVLCCQVPIDLKGADYEMRYNILAGNSMIYQKETNPNFKNLSYSDIYKLRMAYAAKR